MPVVVEICQGTTCFVMGSSELQDIEQYFPDSWKSEVEIRGCACLDRCKNNRYGKAPFVRIDGDVVESATVAGLLTILAEKMRDTDFKLPEELK